MLISVKCIRTYIASILLASALPLIGQDYVDYSTTGLPGKLYDPGSTSESTRVPLILALHGGGGVGSDNEKHLIDFSGLLTYAKLYNACLYIPQATSIYWHAGERPEKIIEMIDKAIEERNADPDRIYVTGFSMGGGGTWDMLKLYPNRFAAGIPIAGIQPQILNKIEALAQTPIWALHARDDSIVNVLQSRRIIDSIIELIGQEPYEYPDLSDIETRFDRSIDIPALRYREFPDGDHFIWWRVYDSLEILDWLFAQRRDSLPILVRIKLVQSSSSLPSLTFEISTNKLANISVEKSVDLNSWSMVQLFTNIPGTIDFETSEPDGFYRAVVVQSTE